MKYPRLVRSAKTPIKVMIESEEINEFGENETLLNAELFCNYQSKAKVIQLSDKETVTLTAVALFDGDIAPNIAEICGGKVFIFGEERKIYTGSKGRNPDGTVNFTRLDLM